MFSKSLTPFAKSYLRRSSRRPDLNLERVTVGDSSTNSLHRVKNSSNFSIYLVAERVSCVNLLYLSNSWSWKVIGRYFWLNMAFISSQIRIGSCHLSDIQSFNIWPILSRLSHQFHGSKTDSPLLGHLIPLEITLQTHYPIKVILWV